MHDLEVTKPHFILCFKPNNKKYPNSFESSEALRQSLYNSAIEDIMTRQQGYVIKEDHAVFYSYFL